MWKLGALLLAGAALPCLGASLAVEVRDASGSPLAGAVVYAVPEGRRPPAPTREAVMDQQDRRFVPHVLVIQTGTAVRFPNSDNVRHQVYSFSSAKKFQLPLYAGTPQKPIVFDRAGVVVLGCNIHDRMSAFVVVVDTPHFGTTEARALELDALPAGSYAVRAWLPGFQREAIPKAVTLGPSDHLELTLSAPRD